MVTVKRPCLAEGTLYHLGQLLSRMLAPFLFLLSGKKLFPGGIKSIIRTQLISAIIKNLQITLTLRDARL